jgi:hypothetical protein
MPDLADPHPDFALQWIDTSIGQNPQAAALVASLKQ